MFPTAEQLSTLANASGWVVLVGFLVIVLSAITAGKLVPGYIYKREIERADKATDLLAGMTSAIDRQTDVTEKLAHQTDVVVQLLTARSRR